MALIKEPLDKAKQRNEELEAAEEAAAQEALGREQEVDRVSRNGRTLQAVAQRDSSNYRKGLPQTVQNKLQPHRKHGKAGWIKSLCQQCES